MNTKIIVALVIAFAVIGLTGAASAYSTYGNWIDTKRNKIYYKNDLMIKKAYMQVLKETGTMPTQQKVAEITGLTQKTIWTHLDAIDLREVVRPFKIWSDEVLNALKDKALEGDYSSARLYFMLTFDWSEKHEVKADIKADVDIKGKLEVKHKLSPKVAKILGDALADEVEEQRRNSIKKENVRKE
jgi:hypothetical protein